MDIIFLGGFFPQQNTDYILKHSKLQIQNAANTFQWAFINGLEENLGKPITLVTAPFIGWFPKYYNHCFIKTTSFSTKGALKNGVMVGYPNLPLIKNIFKYFNISTHLNKIASNKKQATIIIFGLEVAYIKAAINCKNRYPDIKLCVIIPDLPDFPGDSAKLYKWYIQKIEKKLVVGLLQNIDCFIVIAEKMIEYLKIDKKPYQVIEGLYENLEVETDNSMYSESNINELKSILYTGTLDIRYGIRDLLDAFSLITDKNYRLWICGGGSGMDLVKKRIQEDDRIIYYGILPRQEIIKIQKQATLLINPRSPEGDYNKYSFPSKTIEYLASGTPTLLHKIEGIPSEYYEHCFIIEDNTIRNLANSIIKICQLDEKVRIEKGKNARNFILKHKNSFVQCKKAISMYEELLNQK